MLAEPDAKRTGRQDVVASGLDSPSKVSATIGLMTCSLEKCEGMNRDLEHS